MNFKRGLKRIVLRIIEDFSGGDYLNIHKSSSIEPSVKVFKPVNLFMGEHSHIGSDAVIMNTRAKVIIGKHFVSGPKLTIITGNHMPIIGRWLDTVSDSEKDMLDVDHRYDQDVIIEDDVWTGYGVTIMKGVTIGRGSIIAAGAVVTRSLPPYCVGGGYSCKGH